MSMNKEEHFIHFYYAFRISVKARTYVNRDNEWLRDILCVP